MTLRHATLADVDWLAAVDRWPRRDDWQSKIAGRLVYVAEVDGMPVAHARLDVLWSTVPFLAMIEVQTKHRGRGLSRSLLHFVESDLAARGYIALLSSAQTDEPGTQRWHSAMGFASNGIIEHIADGNVGELVYRKLLPGKAS